MDSDIAPTPDLLGLGWDDVRQAAEAEGFWVTGSTPDAEPVTAHGWPDGVVAAQNPTAGSPHPRSEPIVVWFQDDGPSGVREPRRPPAHTLHPATAEQHGPQDDPRPLSGHPAPRSAEPGPVETPRPSQNPNVIEPDTPEKAP